MNKGSKNNAIGITDECEAISARIISLLSSNMTAEKAKELLRLSELQGQAINRMSKKAQRSLEIRRIALQRIAKPPKICIRLLESIVVNYN